VAEHVDLEALEGLVTALDEAEKPAFTSAPTAGDAARWMQLKAQLDRLVYVDRHALLAALRRGRQDAAVLDRMVGLLRESRDSDEPVSEFWRSVLRSVCLDPVQHWTGMGSVGLVRCGKCDLCLFRIAYLPEEEVARG
jgi:hypothetical protein